MIPTACPWCEADAPLDPDPLEGPAAELTCPECATSVLLAPVEVDPAAAA